MATSNRVLSATKLAFAQVQSDLRVIPNSSGAATLSAADALSISNLRLDNRPSSYQSANLTNSRSRQRGIAGRRAADWEVAQDFLPSGTPGVEPDIDPLLQSLFGQAPDIGAGTVAITGVADAGDGRMRVTCGAAHGLEENDACLISGVVGVPDANNAWAVEVVSSTVLDLQGSEHSGTYTSGGTLSKVAVHYRLADASVPVALWQFFSLATAEYKVGFGCTAATGRFTLGGELLRLELSGSGAFVLTNKYFATLGAGSIERGGLSAFPAAPSDPVLTGGTVPGFIGQCIVDGQNIDSILEATVELATGNRNTEDEWNEFFPSGIEGTIRDARFTLRFKDSDSDALANVKNKAISQEVGTLVLRQGNVAGASLIFVLRNCVFEAPTSTPTDFAEQITINGQAYASGLATADEITVSIL